MYAYMDTLGSRTLKKQISLMIYRKDYHVMGHALEMA